MKAIIAVSILLVSIVIVEIKSDSCITGYRASSDCNKYFQCTGAGWVQMSCQPGLHWSVKGHYCDWPSSAGCTGSEESQPEPEPEPQPTTTTTTTTTTAPRPTTTSSTTVQTTTTTTPAPVSGGDAFITVAQFNAAAATKGGNPGIAYYNGFFASLPKAGITTEREAIMFLAHVIWETVGFIYTKEVYCQTNLEACRNAYPANQGGRQDVVYYGRGCLQLTWDYNYKGASYYLYGDDRLIQNPDQVSDDPAVAWDSAAWYWKVAVHDKASTFGGTLKAINGALECEGGSHGQNRILRFNHYKDILRILNLPFPEDSDGWCSAWY